MVPPLIPGRSAAHRQRGVASIVPVFELVLNVPLLVFSYQRTFDEFLEKSKLLRNYRANIIANINNCLSFW